MAREFDEDTDVRSFLMGEMQRRIAHFGGPHGSIYPPGEAEAGLLWAVLHVAVQLERIADQLELLREDMKP